MPKVSEAHVEARRLQIIEAACKCLMRKGLHKTTVREICSEAGLSAGAVYGYFKSKDEIVEALAELGRRNTRALFESGGTGGEPTEALARMLATAIGFLGSPDAVDTARLDLRLWGEGLDTPKLRDLFGRALDSVGEPFVDLVRAGQQTGRIDAGLDPDATARVMIALCLGLVVQRAMDPDADLSGCAAVTSALIDGSFRSPEESS